MPGDQRRALTAGERRRARSVEGAQSIVWRRDVEGCAKPGCVEGPERFHYNSPFALVRCHDCPHQPMPLRPPDADTVEA